MPCHPDVCISLLYPGTHPGSSVLLPPWPGPSSLAPVSHSFSRSLFSEMAFIVLVLHHRQWELIWCLVFVPSINPLQARSAPDLSASLMGLHPNVAFKNITNIYGKAKERREDGLLLGKTYITSPNRTVLL